MADTVIQLKQKIKTAMDNVSNNANIDPAQARDQMAQGIAQAIADFVIGRQTNVNVTVTTTGTATAQTGTGTGTGVIQ